MSRARHTALVVVLGSVLLSLAAAPASAGAPGSIHATGPNPDVTTTNATANNSTTQQVNPDSAGGTGNDKAVRSWLTGRMHSLLKRSSIRLSEGQYQRARGVLGDGYDGYLRKYVDVNGPTARTNRTARTLNETRNDQRSFVKTARKFNRTHRAYKRARANGSQRQARRLARNLAALDRRVQRTNASLVGNYGRLGNGTGTSFAPSRRRVERAARTIDAQSASAVRSTLVRTVVSVRANGTSASFHDPLGLSGRVRTANGTTVNGSVVLHVGGESRQIRLTDSGAFATTYRPVLARTGRTGVRVRYVPPSDSQYLGNATNASAFTVAQVPTSLNATVAPSRAGFGHRLVVAGRLRANGTGVPGVPLTISANGTVLGRVNTIENGTYRGSVRLPAGVPTGADGVRVAFSRRGRAVGPASATTPLTVTSTPSALTVDAHRQGGTVVVSGNLTANGRGVDGQSITFSANGTLVGSAQSGSGGSYRTRIPASRFPAGGTARLVGRFDAAGTNLEPSNAHATVTLPSGSPAGTSGGGTGAPRSVPMVALVVAALFALVVASFFVWRRRRTPDGDAGAHAVTEETGDGPGDDTGAASTPDEPRGVTAPAVDVEADPDAAVERTYAHVRAALGERIETRPLTHWEFFAAVTDADVLTAAETRTLEALTRDYERAVFSQSTADVSRARDVISDAAGLLESRSLGPRSE